MHWSDKDPNIIGWYPIRLCWDEDEGSFMDAEYWNGEDWNSTNGLDLYYPINFENKEDAKNFAYQHDISF